MVTGPVGTDWVGLREVFDRAQPSVQRYREKRWQHSEKFAAWIDEKTLPELSPEQALSLYSTAGGRKTGSLGATPSWRFENPWISCCTIPSSWKDASRSAVRKAEPTSWPGPERSLSLTCSA